VLTNHNFSTDRCHTVWGCGGAALVAAAITLMVASAPAAAQRYSAVPLNRSAPINVEALPTLGVAPDGFGGPGLAAKTFGRQNIAPAAFGGSGDLRSRLGSRAGLVVAGQNLRGELLHRFYATHNFRPVWEHFQPQANAMRETVLRADEHGLDPDLFHGRLLQNLESLSPLDRELLLSDAFLSYADALARGAVPIEARTEDEELTPDPVDIVAVLNYSIGHPDPGAALEALAPRSPTYMALREALRSHGGLPRAGGKGADARLRTILVNLERQRWLPRRLPEDRVWVDIIGAQTSFYRNSQPVFTTRVIVGAPSRAMQTPEMQSEITSVLFNPPWNVPPSIAARQILPRLAKDPNYLTTRRMIRRSDGTIQQLPGPGTALGHLKFEMENLFGVYLHDTPSKALFNRDKRRISNGCIRVQKPRELAALLMQQPVSAIDRAIAPGTTNRGMLPVPVPTFLVYQTAVLDSGGSLAFRPDVYNRDDRIWRLLTSGRQAPMARNESSRQQRS
jgi:L,D-transpeptidase YcbB